MALSPRAASSTVGRLRPSPLAWGRWCGLALATRRTSASTCLVSANTSMSLVELRVNGLQLRGGGGMLGHRPRISRPTRRKSLAPRLADTSLAARQHGAHRSAANGASSIAAGARGIGRAQRVERTWRVRSRRLAQHAAMAASVSTISVGERVRGDVSVTQRRADPLLNCHVLPLMSASTVRRNKRGFAQQGLANTRVLQRA